MVFRLRHYSACSTSPPRIVQRRGARTLLPLLLVAAALGLVGCIRAEVSIKVNEDGSGVVSALAAFDKEMLEEIAENLGDGVITEVPLFGGIDQADLPDGATVEAYDEGGFTGIRVSIPVEATADIAAAVEDMLSNASSDGVGLPGAMDPLLEDFDLRRTGEGWRFEATVAPFAAGAEGEDSLGLGGAISGLVFAEASFQIKVALPGEVIEHNADRIDGDTLVWELGFAATEPRRLLAVTRTEDGGGGFPLVAVVGVTALVVAGTAAGVWFVSRNRPAANGV